MEMNEELLEKAKQAKTPDELSAIAKENGTEMTDESAKEYFDLLHPRTGELSDDELDNVSGGCGGGGYTPGNNRRTISTGEAGRTCSNWGCKLCKKDWESCSCSPAQVHHRCADCKYFLIEMASDGFNRIYCTF